MVLELVAEFLHERDRRHRRRIAEGTDRVADDVVGDREEQVEVLVFLNQFTTKLEDGETTTGTTQFRLKVTMIDDEDRGWLVSDIDAR